MLIIEHTGAILNYKIIKCATESDIQWSERLISAKSSYLGQLSSNIQVVTKDCSL